MSDPFSQLFGSLASAQHQNMMAQSAANSARAQAQMQFNQMEQFQNAYGFNQGLGSGLQAYSQANAYRPHITTASEGRRSKGDDAWREKYGYVPDVEYIDCTDAELAAYLAGDEPHPLHNATS